MALNRLLSTLALAALLGGAAWAAQDAQANFAASPGFSGRNGATCLACHTVAPVGHVDATAVLEGLPTSWVPGQSYHLTLRVEGGPEALPAPAPQGGLDLSIDGGVLSVPAAMDGLLYTPNPQEITYRPAGTLMRAWQADWTAPNLATRPTERHVWLAVLAASGNHVIATNSSDGGERFDSAANMTATIPPAPETMAAWRALPLLPPEAKAEVSDDYVMVTGRHVDANATAVAWSLDGGAWQTRDAAADWHVRLDGLAAGPHTFAYRSQGSDRQSPERRMEFTAPGFSVPLPGGHRTPSIGFAPIALLLAALAILRSRP